MADSIESVRSFHTPDTLDLRLPTKLALGADFAGYSRDLRGEYGKLLDHRIDELGRTQELTFERAPVHLQLHGLPKVAPGDRADSACPREWSRRPGAPQQHDSH
jgi:hypothetical protein